MGHLTYQSYDRLQRRLSQYVPGAYNSETLYEILKLLVTDEEAQLCALMPLNVTSAATLASIWQLSEAEARARLEALAAKGIVYVFLVRDEKRYALAPPVLGFFEFSLMRTDGKFDSKALAELYHQYCNVEGDFIRQQGQAKTGFTRVFVHEDTLEGMTSEVMTWDRISAGIDSASCITTGWCYCRHKMQHLGKACDGPMDACLTFNDTARYLAEYGIARQISKEEAHRIVKQCMDHGLVQIGENKKNALVVICNCCGCCCDLLLGYKRFGSHGLVQPSAFEATVEAAHCDGCAICEQRCPVDAITMVDAKPVVDRKVCLGCGVCARFCPPKACTMTARAVPPEIPEDLLEKMLLSGVQMAKLGNFLFDDQRSPVHAALRGLVNSALRLPPVRRLVLARSVRSRLLDIVRNSKRYRDLQGTPAPRPDANPEAAASESTGG